METIWHQMLAELRIMRLEVGAMAATLADAQAAFNELNVTAQQVLAELQAARTGEGAHPDATSLVTSISALNGQFTAALQPAPPPSGATPTPEQPAIDPNTGQPVQPV